MAKMTLNDIALDETKPVKARTRRTATAVARRSRRKRAPAAETDRSDKMVKVALGDKPIFPYLVIRLIAGFYTNEKIHIGPWPPVNRKSGWIVVVHPDPWENGRLRPEVRQAVIDQVIARCRAQKAFRMCIVFGKDEQIYVEPDGTFKVERDKVPSMSLGVGADGKLPALGMPVHRLPDETESSEEVPK
jgi:hypothetical protein